MRALLVAALLFSQSRVRPEDYCGVFGCPDDDESWSAVFDSMLRSSECAPGANDAVNSRQSRFGCSVQLEGHDYLTDGLEVCRPVVFEGVGGCEGTCASRLLVTANRRGIRVPGWDTRRGNGCSWGKWHIGGGLTLERVELASLGGTSTAAVGIQTAGTIRLLNAVVSRS